MRSLLGVTLCLACHGDRTVVGQAGAGGDASTGGNESKAGSQCVENFGSAIEPICSVGQCQAAATGAGFNGCLVCEGLACLPEDTCSAWGHSNGPADTGCSCVAARFDCWIRQRPVNIGAGFGGAAPEADDAGEVEDAGR